MKHGMDVLTVTQIVMKIILTPTHSNMEIVIDRFACVDTDLDGISDLNDPYPNTPTSNISDWDDDGYPDNLDNPSLNNIHSIRDSMV